MQYRQLERATDALQNSPSRGEQNQRPACPLSDRPTLQTSALLASLAMSALSTMQCVRSGQWAPNSSPTEKLRNHRNPFGLKNRARASRLQANCCRCGLGSGFKIEIPAQMSSRYSRWVRTLRESPQSEIFAAVGVSRIDPTRIAEISE
jgi:hypothetical protein